MQDERAITATHLTATTPDGQRYTLVTIADGQFAIARDGQLLVGLAWPADQVTSCTTEFARLTQLKP
jgi:hypothetical protein